MDVLHYMYTLVDSQTALTTKGFVSHTAMEWTFSTMYTLVDSQIALANKGNVTHTAMEWTFSTMYTLVDSQSALATKGFVTHCNKMDVSHYVHAGGRSECPSD
jgi:uncharacterized UBP type Zn finger protein